MTLLPFAQWLAETKGSIALHESLLMYPLIESIHVWRCAVSRLCGRARCPPARVVDARVPVSDVARRLLPWMTAGFVVMVITGTLLFYAIPVRSYQSVWFRVKLISSCLPG